MHGLPSWSWDAAVVAAYGLILPQAMLDAPRLGCLNIHASLLPRWRGAGPIQAAILAGDAESGVTIMQMEAGLDTGPMLLAEAVPIGPRTTAAALHDALADMGARLVLRALAEAPAARPQPEGATYAPKLTKESGRLDWTAGSAQLDRVVRAMVPWPGAWTVLAGGNAEGAGGAAGDRRMVRRGWCWTTGCWWGAGPGRCGYCGCSGRGGRRWRRRRCCAVMRCRRGTRLG